MLRKKNLILSSALSIIAATSINAYASSMENHIIIAPQCLIKNLSIAPHILSSNKTFALLEITNEGIDQLIEAKNNDKTRCGGFMDVSDDWHDFNSKHARIPNTAKSFLTSYTTTKTTLSASAPNAYSIKYPTQVNQLLTQINPQNMWSYLTTLTNYKDRYANSDNGVNAANWIKTQIETFASQNNRHDVTVYLVSTGTQYKQPSVVAKIGDADAAGVVIGAHMDTLKASYSNKPGADDDGSGSVTVLETARTLLASGMEFKKPIYLIWYAAEEEGLVGSSYVVKDFKKKNIPVDAVMHFDLTGYAHNNEKTMWLMDDYVNKDLVAYLEKLIQTYVKQPVKHSKCGYACSDHASWTQAGYPAALPAESAYEDTNPSIHSADDTMNNLSLSHMTDYLKLATAFAVEMAEPK